MYNLLEIYKEQLAKDKEQIKTLNRLLENQQILALESNKKIKKLENELEKERQLSYPFDKFLKDKYINRTQEAIYNEENQNEDININENPQSRASKQYEKIEDKHEQQPSKKGFWSRILGRRYK